MTIQTSIGEIAYYINEVPGTTPIVLLHGVYYDHELWDYQVDKISTHTTVTIDMPLHGASKSITKKDWDMDDCATMLIEVLDALNIDECIAVGHSWGSMTILRAANHHPERFVAVGLSNMPLEPGGFGTKMKFAFQGTAMPFRNFYANQVANVMFSKSSRQQKPELVEYLHTSMDHLTIGDIKQTTKAVITTVDDGVPYVESLQVPALALTGDEDYVPVHDAIPTTVIPGKHTSPLEQPEEVLKLIRSLIELESTSSLDS